jgi:FkbM family methyltransferase
MAFTTPTLVERVRNTARVTFWSAPPAFIPLLIQIRFRKKFKKRIKLSHSDGVLKLTEFNSSGDVRDFIYFFHPLRTTRYFDGIGNRLEKLLEEYCINQIPDLHSGVFVDVGSNVGEFSLGILKRFPTSKFIRFEPSYEENLASKKNLSVATDILIPKALWSEQTELTFYRRNEHGDSSLFTPDDERNAIRVQTTTLDDEIEKIYPGEIELLKLEAEGAEPEILRGGEKTIKRCRYVSADLGPERGILQESTFDEATGILKSYGFSLIGKNRGARQCYLFKNSNFGKSNIIQEYGDV